MKVVVYARLAALPVTLILSGDGHFDFVGGRHPRLQACDRSRAFLFLALSLLWLHIGQSLCTWSLDGASLVASCVDHYSSIFFSIKLMIKYVS